MRSVSGTRWLLPSARWMTSVASDCGVIGAGHSMSTVSLPVSPRLDQVVPDLNCSGSTPMPTRLLRWMRSKLRATTAWMPSSCVPLAAQSRLEPVPYSSPANTTVGMPCDW